VSTLDQSAAGVNPAAGAVTDGTEAGTEAGTSSPKPSQAQQLVELALDGEAGSELWHTPGTDGEPYATIVQDDHREHCRIRSSRFRRHLANRFYAKTKKAPSTQAMQNALQLLEAIAVCDGAAYPTAIRIAAEDSGVYLDLCRSDWSAVYISPDGWRWMANPPVRFRHARGMQSLPEPERHGTVDGLRAFVNVSDASEFYLLVAWLLAALRPSGPYPVLVLHGEQGSAKSTVTRVLRQLCDPNDAPLRAEPRDERDLSITASNSWLIALDNLDRVHPRLSNALCRLSTGGGFSTRTLFTDDDEQLFDAMRPVVLNGITEIATRPDLLDRAVILHLPALADSRRLTEGEFWQAFTEQQPALLGALLDALAGAMRELPDVHLAKAPRMADFGRFGVAVERTLGWPAGAFLAAYTANRASAHALALEDSRVAMALASWLAPIEGGSWTGTAADLLENLSHIAGEKVTRLDDWPKTPSALSGHLHRLAPALRATGTDIRFGRSNRQRTISIESACKRASPASPASPTPSERTGDGAYAADIASGFTNGGSQ
jgi:hypothetical protein